MGSERSMAVNPVERIRILPLVRNTQRFGPRRPKVSSPLRKVCGLTDTTSLPGLHRSKPRRLTRRGKPGAPRGRASALTDPNLRGLKHSRGGLGGGQAADPAPTVPAAPGPPRRDLGREARCQARPHGTARSRKGRPARGQPSSRQGHPQPGAPGRAPEEAGAAAGPALGEGTS